MAEAARLRQDTGELDASVSALIDRAESLRDDGGDDGRGDGLDLVPESRPSNAAVAAQPENPAPLSPDDDELLKSVQRLLKEVPAGPGVRPSTPPTPPESAELELPPDFVAPAVEPTKRPSPPEDASRIESLDQELAGLADELISTELAAEPAPEEGAETLAGAVQAAAAPPEAAPETAPEPVPELAPTPAAIPEPEPAPEPRPRRRLTLEPVLRPLLAACAAISAPLRDKPQHVRDIVGWNALWLAFLGGCVWMYVLFIRSPEPPVPSLLPTKAAAVHAGDKAHGPAKKDSHAKAPKAGAKKGSHAKAEPKSGGHH